MTVSNVVSSAKSTSMLFRRVGDMKAWQLYVANAVFLFLAGMVVAMLRRAIPTVLGDGELAKVAMDTVTLTKAAAVTGQYQETPENFKVV
tara:strand:- start:831 stop:1100 length:270 start_codon:yes stop_codon:yes gene_type:complete